MLLCEEPSCKGDIDKIQDWYQAKFGSYEGWLNAPRLSAVKFKEMGMGYEDCLKIFDGLIFCVPSGRTRADLMKIDSGETDDSSVKNFPILRATL